MKNLRRRRRRRRENLEPRNESPEILLHDPVQLASHQTIPAIPRLSRRITFAEEEGIFLPNFFLLFFALFFFLVLVDFLFLFRV